MSAAAPSPAEPTDAAACWRRLAEGVDALVGAWRAGRQDFSLRDYLPTDPAPLRKIALIELVKVDMEQRLAHGAALKRVEDYLAEFPELADDGDVPCDLIYEEYHLRQSRREPVGLPDYCARFPKQADRLARLFARDDVTATTSLTWNLRLPQLPAIGERLDDFDLLARLGQGAFATVFLARQRSLDRLVALKVSDDRGSESQTLAQLDHPNIVRVFDQRRLPAERLRLLYMQFIPGGTLQSVIRRHSQLPQSARSGATFLAAINEALARSEQAGSLDSAARRKLQEAGWPEVVCWLGARLATALAYAHEHGVLHRDVKPANVLLGRDGSPKLVDFNISFNSKLDGATPAAFFGGSLAYMSPEQLEACDPAQPLSPQDLDGRSDVYSLGVLLWELLTGQRPFVDDLAAGDWRRTLARMAVQRKAGVDPARYEQWPPNCPAGLREALAAALVGDRDERTASAAELARSLELCLMPRAQRLLCATTARALSARRYPISTLVVAGLAPNLVMSVLNSVYNWSEAVRHLTLADQRMLLFQLLIVNGIAYAWAVAMALYLCWPVVTSMRELRKPLGRRRPTPRRLARLRSRALRLGDYAAWICAVDWAFSGFVFPGWMQAQSGATSLTTHDYVRFIASQFLCGLIAATMTFFLVTLGALRACYPRLIGPVPALTAVWRWETVRSDPDVSTNIVERPPSESDDPPTDVVLADRLSPAPASGGEIGAVQSGPAGWDGVALRFPSGAPRIGESAPASPAEHDSAEDIEPSDLDQLRALARRVLLYFGLAVVAPFLAVMVVVFLDDDRGAIGGLGIVGLVAFALAFCLALRLRGDVAALATAIRPSGRALFGDEDLSDSFFPGSRR